MKMSVRTVVMGIAVALIAALSGFAAQVEVSRRALSIDRALDGIEKCAELRDAVACSREFVKTMLAKQEPSEVMEEIAGRISPLQCHYIGHVVGQEYYAAHPTIESTIAACGRMCDSACVHGAIGSSFAETLDKGGASSVREQFDLKHLGFDDFAVIGKKLCISADACHGVGHAVFQSTGNLKSAVEGCTHITGEPRAIFCYTGAFMEYADVLSSRNMSPVDNVVPPKKSELKTFCTQYDDVTQRRGCFRYFPRIVIETLTRLGETRDEAYAEVPKMCESMKDDHDRVSCYIGIGAYHTYLILTDPQAAMDKCTGFSSPQAVSACLLGEITVAVEDRQKVIIPYCGMLPSEKLQAACYQQVFFFINRTDGSVEESAKLCPVGNALCAQGAKDYEQDAWELVLKNFER